MTLCGCARSGSAKAVSKSAVFFDTVVSVDIYPDNSAGSEEIAEKCLEICDHYQKLFDEKIKTSDIAKINSSAGQTVPVDHDTAVMISDALYYSSLSNGKFDITIDPVSDLWDFHEGTYRVPSDNDLEKACKLVDYRNVNADTKSNTVTLLSPGTSIDVGGAAKGYIADRIADYLKTQSITGAIINMGGDMYLLGTKPDKDLFNIGINDPDANGCVMSLYLSDCAVATSGTYERTITQNGQVYHHILDPRTGKSADTDIKSVTVISNSSMTSDCLCTVCILLGSDRSMQLIENLPDTEAIMILNDGSIIKSSGSDSLIRH